MAARLLIVDDHEVVRLGVRTLFANNDSFAVCGEAQTGPDAIRMVSQISPDVVILDLSMPGMNGFEIASRIRQIAPSTRIIFFSFHEIPATARLAGADAFVSKSAPLQELALTVNRVMHAGESVECGATSESREARFSEMGGAFRSARASAHDSIMPAESTERRHQPRNNLPHVVRIRPFDLSTLSEDCTALNISQNGLYFVTSKSHYSSGANVYVTGDFHPENPMEHAVAGVVVRIDQLRDDQWGVAIHIFSPLLLLSTVH